MIKSFIIAAVTADGFIAKDANHAATWTSKADKKRFVELTKRAGVVVMGYPTFRTLPRPLKDRVNIVYSRQTISIEGAEVTTDEPRLLLEKLEQRGFTEVAICGGSQIYTLFMKAGVVERLYLTVEPLFFGQGLTLFKESLDAKLRLEKMEQVETGTLFLDYRVEQSET